MKLARHFRVPFVFEVRDLWPEALTNIGALSNPLVIWWLRRMARRILSRCRSHRRPVARHESGNRSLRCAGRQKSRSSQTPATWTCSTPVWTDRVPASGLA